MMYLIFKKEQWEEYKAEIIKAATEKEKVFATDFFAMSEKQGTWIELDLPE